MMLFEKTDKKKILDLLRTGSTSYTCGLDKGNTIPSLNDEEFLLVWKEDDLRSRYFPIYVCTPSGKVREFLAWASTYMQQMRPFTAFTRVIDIDEFISLQQHRSIPVTSNFTSALIGLLVGETLELQNWGLVKYVNSMAAKNTCSYSIVSAIIHNSPYKKDEIAQKFFAVRKFAKIPFPAPLITSINGILQNLFKIMDTQSFSNNSFDERLTFFPICNALDEIANGVELTKWTIEDILRQPLNLIDIPLKNQKVEDRVEAFEKACSLIVNSKQIHPQSASFIIACLANQISPGTMRHHSLLVPFARIYPGVFMWYGLCAGLTPNSDVFSYSGGLGWRISRQIMTEPSTLDYPNADICFNEFELLRTLENPEATFNTDWASNLSVELVPGITILIPWPPKANQPLDFLPNEDCKQPDFFDLDNRSITIEILGDRLHELVNMFDKLSLSKRKYSVNESKPKAKCAKGRSKS